MRKVLTVLLLAISIIVIYTGVANAEFPWYVDNGYINVYGHGKIAANGTVDINIDALTGPEKEKYFHPDFLKYKGYSFTYNAYIKKPKDEDCFKELMLDDYVIVSKKEEARGFIGQVTFFFRTLFFGDEDKTEIARIPAKGTKRVIKSDSTETELIFYDGSTIRVAK